MNEMKAENERLKKTLETMLNGIEAQDLRQFDTLRNSKDGKEEIAEMEHLRHSIEVLEKKGFKHEKRLMSENHSLKRELGKMKEKNEALLSKVDALNKEIRSLKQMCPKEPLRAFIDSNDQNMTKKERIAAMRENKKRLNAIIEKLNLARAKINAELGKLKQNGKKCAHTKKDAYFGDRENFARWHIFGHKHCLEQCDNF